MAKHIYDPAFKYTPASKTDLAKKFRRIQRELKLEQARQEQAKNEATRKVRQITRKVG